MFVIWHRSCLKNAADSHLTAATTKDQPANMTRVMVLDLFATAPDGEQHRLDWRLVALATIFGGVRAAQSLMFGG
jgi:hypothetical protein